MKKILVIEDDVTVAHVYHTKLSHEGFEVDVAGDGEAGLAKVRSFRPDVVLLDLVLPKLPGIDVIRKLRSEPDFQRLPIIVLTNTYLRSMMQEAWKAGATKCLSKAAATPKEVLQTIHECIRNNSPAAPSAPAAPASNAPAAPRSGPAAPAPVSPKPAAANADAAFQADIRKTFLEGVPATLAALRSSLQYTIKAPDDTVRVKHLRDMHHAIRGITGPAGLSGLTPAAQLSDALEALLKELHEKPENINASTLRTAASAIDCLAVLLKEGVALDETAPPVSVLVVDDDPISRRAVVYALDKAKLKSVSAADPLVAFQLLKDRKFGLIFLDVDMPNMNGHELCSRIRKVPAYARTPVVFVTGLNDFENRANSTMSGGNDFIGKPFLFIELAVKALLYVLRGRLVGGAG